MQPELVREFVAEADAATRDVLRERKRIAGTPCSMTNGRSKNGVPEDDHW